MPEIILFFILFIFIGGMLWSDRDSRRVRWYEQRDTLIDHFIQAGYGAHRLAFALQSFGRSIRKPPYFTPDERFHNPEIHMKCETVPYLVDILDQYWPVVTIKKGCSVGVSTSFMPDREEPMIQRTTLLLISVFFTLAAVLTGVYIWGM